MVLHIRTMGKCNNRRRKDVTKTFEIILQLLSFKGNTRGFRAAEVLTSVMRRRESLFGLIREPTFIYHKEPQYSTQKC